MERSEEVLRFASYLPADSGNFKITIPVFFSPTKANSLHLPSSELFLCPGLFLSPIYLILALGLFNYCSLAELFSATDASGRYCTLHTSPSCLTFFVFK